MCPHLAQCPVYCLPEDILHQTVGFQFHAGIMASGSREVPTSFRDSIAGWFDSKLAATFWPRETLLVLPALNSAENLGSMVRSGVGLGAAGMIVTPQSADPLSRRVLRVSMGHALYFPSYTSLDWMDDLRRLRDAGFRLIGIENHHRMIPLQDALIEDRQALVFGNEFEGIGEQVLDLMDDIVGIPRQPQVDSLNVAVAAAIALHHFAVGAPQSSGSRLC